MNEKASYFVSEMRRKYGANPWWVWEVLDAEMNIIKGYGGVLTDEEYHDMEQVIISGMKGEW